MLDNVIDINYYGVAKARNSNLKHRPVGMGIMGFQDCLHAMRIPYASQAAVDFADTSMEVVCYNAYWANSDLAAERGRYPTFKGSLAKVDRVTQEVRHLYSTAYEVDASWIIEAAGRRQKWIDQAQSLNLYFPVASGKKLDETYKLAWLRGIKTTYYLRTLGATDAKMSTGRGGELNAVANSVSSASNAASGMGAAGYGSQAVPAMPDAEGAVCVMRPGDVGFEECEACQ
jgi:ribonucleotide reductase alpha subunit